MSVDFLNVRRTQFSRLVRRLRNVGAQLETPAPIQEGKLVHLSGMRLEVEGLHAGIGSRCRIATDAYKGHGRDSHHSHEGLDAEVIGFNGSRLVLMCEGSVEGLRPGAKVNPLLGSSRVSVGPELLGRVIDGAGNPLDGRSSCLGSLTMPFRGGNLNPMKRGEIREPIDVGIRAINSLVTIGRGQRMGLFAGSGVGKSTLLGMMTRFTSADVVVVCLVGERGREVREFVEDSLGEDGLKKAIIVATPADTSPLMRVAGCWRATAIAEYYRSQGLNVLLLVDSLTRFAQAQREIGLAAGEPPVSRGYTPSVFSALPSLIERTGNYGPGSITAIYTVLTENDDLQDPIADAARAILDGHVVLSRKMAESGVFPAIDIEASISRVMLQITDEAHQKQSRMIKEAVSTLNSNRDLIAIGAYRPGSDPKIDMAIRHQDRMRALVEQSLNQPADYTSSLVKLAEAAVVMEADYKRDNAQQQGAIGQVNGKIAGQVGGQLQPAMSAIQ